MRKIASWRSDTGETSHSVKRSGKQKERVRNGDSALFGPPFSEDAKPPMDSVGMAVFSTDAAKLCRLRSPCHVLHHRIAPRAHDVVGLARSEPRIRGSRKSFLCRVQPSVGSHSAWQGIQHWEGRFTLSYSPIFVARRGDALRVLETAGGAGGSPGVMIDIQHLENKSSSG